MLPEHRPGRPAVGADPKARALYVAAPLSRPVTARSAVAPRAAQSPARRLWVVGPLHPVPSTDTRRRRVIALRVVAGVAGAAAAAALSWLAYLLVVAVIALISAVVAWVMARLLIIGAVAVAALVLLAKAGAGSGSGCAGLHCKGCRR